MKATVLVRPKPGILDPQGEAVQSSLRQLGFRVGEARVGRVVDLELENGDLLVIHAMPLRDRYREQYEEAKKWRR